MLIKSSRNEMGQLLALVLVLVPMSPVPGAGQHYKVHGDRKTCALDYCCCLAQLHFHPLQITIWKKNYSF